MKTFCLCGEELTLLDRLGRGVCKTCQSSMDRDLEKQLEVRNSQVREKEQQDKEGQIARAVGGEATELDVLHLTAEGYIFVEGRLIACPICGHRQFQQHEAQLNTRLATFFDLDWTNRAGVANICLRCDYILWFAPSK
jgi:predicted nucleic-acid-binding Zn-ribbon protein